MTRNNETSTDGNGFKEGLDLFEAMRSVDTSTSLNDRLPSVADDEKAIGTASGNLMLFWRLRNATIDELKKLAEKGCADSKLHEAQHAKDCDCMDEIRKILFVGRERIDSMNNILGELLNLEFPTSKYGNRRKIGMRKNGTVVVPKCDHEISDDVAEELADLIVSTIFEGKEGSKTVFLEDNGARIKATIRKVNIGNMRFG